MGFLSRKPDSNENINSSSNPWGSKNPDLDNFYILLSGKGKRCIICQRVVLNCHLTEINGKYYCPDHKPEGKP